MSDVFNRDMLSTLQKDIGDEYRICLHRSGFGFSLIRIYPAPFGIYDNKKSVIVFEGDNERAQAIFKSIENAEIAREYVSRGW